MNGSELKTSLFLMLWIYYPPFAGYAPDSVQIALTKMYPSAAGIAWSQDEAYYVNGFYDERFDTRSGSLRMPNG